MKTNVILQLEGNTNDLLTVTHPNNDLSMKSTRLIKLDPNATEINEEIVDLQVASTNAIDEHPIFNQILDKKIRITLETIEED